MRSSPIEGNYTVRYLISGALFGAAFPVFATFFLLIYEHLPFSLASAAELHLTRPLLLVIDTAPIFLGLFAMVAGTKQDMVKEYNVSLQASNQRLAEEIAQKEVLAQQFEQEKIKAEEAAEIKSQFLSIISHEIRMPLNAVIGMSHSLLEDNPRPDQVEDIKNLKYTAEGLRTLVSDTLNLSKNGSGRIRLEQTPFDFHQLVTNLQRSLDPQMLKKEVRLEIHFDESMPSRFIGDPVRISQIILNLMGSAIKFTERGSVSVSFSLYEQIEDQATIRCAVKLPGVSITAEELDQLFNNFSQANFGTHQRYGGNELGLTITWKLLELYNSRIRVETTVNQSPTFSFQLTLPVATELSTAE